MSDIQVTAVDGNQINVSTGTVVGPLPELQLAAGNGINITSSNGVSTISTNLTIPANLADLGDVSVSNATSGQALTYNGTAWGASNISSGSMTLAGLTDVNLTVSTVQNGQVLTYNNGTWSSGYSVERINGLTDDVYITSPTGAISVATSATAGEVALDINWPTLPSGVTAIQTVDGGVLVQWHEPIPQEGPYVVEYQEISSLAAPNITGTAQV